MADEDKDHYAILGVSRTSTPADIKSAYNKLVLINHPDKGGDREKFIKIQNAYEALRDPQSRKLYDAGLQRAEARKAREEAQAKKEEGYDQQKARKEANKGKGEREAREAPGPHRPPRMPNAQPYEPYRPPRAPKERRERRERDEGHKNADEPDADKKQRRRQAPSFFAHDGPFTEEGGFLFEAFTDFQGFTAGFEIPPSWRRIPGPGAREHAAPPSVPKPPKKEPASEPRREKEKSPPKNRAGNPPCPRCGEEHPHKYSDEPHGQRDELTFEILISRATEHCTQFDYAVQKLRTTMAIDEVVKHDALWSHFAHVKDAFSKRLLTITLARQDHSVQELRKGLKEGSTKPDKEHLAKISSKLDIDCGFFKKVAKLMDSLYEAVKMLNESDQTGCEHSCRVMARVEDLNFVIVDHFRD